MNFRSKELKYNRIMLYHCWNFIHNFISKNPANGKGNTSSDLSIIHVALRRKNPARYSDTPIAGLFR